MKFFTASLIVLLSTAILGVSYGSPANKDLLGGLGGLVGGVLNTADTLLGNVLQTVHQTVADISDALRNILNQLPSVTSQVVNTVEKLLQDTGKILVSTVEAVEGVANDLLAFTSELTDGLITINLDTLEVCVNGEAIGTVEDDGSIIDLEETVIGLLDTVNGALVLVGDTVDGLLTCVTGLLNNVLQLADQILGGGVLAAVNEAIANITDDLREVLDELPILTADVVNAVEQLLLKTGKVLVCTVEELVNNILTFSEASGEGLRNVSVNLETLEVAVGGHIIGTISQDGSITDSQRNIIGLFDNENGLIILAGRTVQNLLHTVTGVVNGLLSGLLGGFRPLG